MHCPAGAAARCLVPPLRPKPPILVQCAGMFLNIFKLRVKSLKRLGRFYPSYFEHFSNFARANSYRLNTPEHPLNTPMKFHLIFRRVPTTHRLSRKPFPCWRTAGALLAPQPRGREGLCGRGVLHGLRARRRGGRPGRSGGPRPATAPGARRQSTRTRPAGWLQHAGCTLAARWRDRDAVYVLSPR